MFVMMQSFVTHARQSLDHPHSASDFLMQAHLTNLQNKLNLWPFPPRLAKSKAFAPLLLSNETFLVLFQKTVPLYCLLLRRFELASRDLLIPVQCYTRAARPCWNAHQSTIPQRSRTLPLSCAPLCPNIALHRARLPMWNVLRRHCVQLAR